MTIRDMILDRIRVAGGAARTAGLAMSRHERRVLKSLVDERVLFRVGYGTYSLPETPPAIQLARMANAQLTCVSAVDIAGLRTLHAPSSAHLSLPRDRGRLQLPNTLPVKLTIHREPTHWIAPQPDAQQIHALWPAVFARIAICQPFIEAVVAIDSGLNHGLVTASEIFNLLKGSRVKQARKAVAAACGSSQSVLETLARLELLDSGFKIEPQKLIEPAGFVDLLVENQIVVELDGFEHHASRSQFNRDRYRDRQLALLGYDVLRYTYDEVVRSPKTISDDVRALLNLRATRSAWIPTIPRQHPPFLGERSRPDLR